MNQIMHLKAWAEERGDLFFDMVRIYLGVGLFVKGIYFVTHRDFLLSLMKEAGNLWFAPAAMGHYVILSHLIGGLCLAIGFVTRLAALIQIPVLMGAVFYLHLPKMVNIEPRQYLEFSALVLFLLVLILIRGAGLLSADFQMSKKKDARVL